MTTGEKLAALDDEKFSRYLLRAVKNRHEHPDWWAAFLLPEVIDDAEDVLTDTLADAHRQMEEGGYPGAKRFSWRVQEALDEIALARIVREEG